MVACLGFRLLPHLLLLFCISSTAKRRPIGHMSLGKNIDNDRSQRQQQRIVSPTGETTTVIRHEHNSTADLLIPSSLPSTPSKVQTATQDRSSYIIQLMREARSFEARGQLSAAKSMYEIVISLTNHNIFSTTTATTIDMNQTQVYSRLHLQEIRKRLSQIKRDTTRRMKQLRTSHNVERRSSKFSLSAERAANILAESGNFRLARFEAKQAVHAFLSQLNAGERHIEQVVIPQSVAIMHLLVQLQLYNSAVLVGNALLALSPSATASGGIYGTQRRSKRVATKIALEYLSMHLTTELKMMLQCCLTIAYDAVGKLSLAKLLAPHQALQSAAVVDTNNAETGRPAMTIRATLFPFARRIRRQNSGGRGGHGSGGHGSSGHGGGGGSSSGRSSRSRSSRSSGSGSGSSSGSTSSESFSGVERVDGRTLTSETFYRKYVSHGRPVILTHLMDDWKGLQRWKSASDLAETFGPDRLFPVAHSTHVYPLQYVFGPSESPPLRISTTLQNFLHQEKHRNGYIFAPLFGDVGNILYDNMKHPALFDGSYFVTSQEYRTKKALFAIGRTGSGVYFHDHSSSWRAQFVGSTKWYLMPPGSLVAPRFGPMSAWNRTKKEQSPDVLEFEQHAGDIVYLPDLWQHATINVNFTVAVAVEVGYYNKVSGSGR